MPVRYYRDDKGIVFHNANKGKIHTEGYRPCQYCINCRLTKAESNAIRMVHEAQFHEQNSFLTLTYDDRHIPQNNSLDYTHVQKFMKKLRRRIQTPVSFYRVGEYGDQLTRPHYHLIIFGYDFSEPIKYHGEINRKTKSGVKDDRTYYKSTFATELWQKGFVDVGDVDYATCQYVAKYVTKKLYGTDARAYGDRLHETASSSKLNPIGKRWIEKYYTDVYPHDYVVHNGKKLQPPRYYDEWLKQNQTKLYSLVKQQREDAQKDQILDYRELHAQHVIRRQKQNSFLRDGQKPNLKLDEELIKRKLEIINLVRKGEL